MTHYLILRTERTGYPFPVHDPEVVGYCPVCGRAVYDYETDFWLGFIDYELVCKECKDEDEEWSQLE